MIGLPLGVRCLAAGGTAAVLVSCASADSTSDSAAPEPSRTIEMSGPHDAGRQGYLDAVNALCDDLLPRVVEATHGGSIDVPAKEWVATWPAHKALLDGFDADLAGVPVPPAAADTARVMADYVSWATVIDDRRITAARRGEAAWRAEVTAEADIMDTPQLRALGTAGFANSCQAR